MQSNTQPEYQIWLNDLKSRIQHSQQRAILSVNHELILLYWHIGRDILQRQAQQSWGAKIITQLSQDLSAAFPEMKGFSVRNLDYMRQFAEQWTDFAIVQQAAAQLPWGHHIVLLNKIHNPNEKLWYAQNAIQYGWSRNVLLHQIESQLHQRTGQAINNFTQTLPEIHSDLAKQTFKDPYIFDFLDLTQIHQEHELERALTQHITQFLLELGAGFAFVGKQIRVNVGGDDFYLDLLFYHLKLRCYVVVELKTGDFKPEHIGQLNFYLTAVDKQIKSEYDAPTIGLLLCKNRNKVVVEYALHNNTQPIGVAEYQLKQALLDFDPNP